jgi:hypothetical protein
MAKPKNKVTLPSGKILSNHYTDQDILNVLGNYTQGGPSTPDWNYLIDAYDAARYAGLNPARQSLFDRYVAAGLEGNTTEQKELIDSALASDQPYIDEEIDLQYGGNGVANRSPGTVQAQRRFAYGWTSGPAYSPNPDPPPPTTTTPPPGPIAYTLVPPPPYTVMATTNSSPIPGVDYQPLPYAGC